MGRVKEGEMKLKLYVWDEFYPDYYDGLAFAIAESEEEAIKLVEATINPPYLQRYNREEWGAVKVFNSDEKIAFSRNGGG
jgi:hypothetical protein